MASDKHIITAENITKKYGEITAVDDLDLQIQEGEIFGFLGPNGAGKTTTIRMLVGLLAPTEGRIAIRDHDVRSARSKLGVCPQENVLWTKLTCYENLYFIGKMYDVPPRRLEEITPLEDCLWFGLVGRFHCRTQSRSKTIPEP